VPNDNAGSSSVRRVCHEVVGFSLWHCSVDHRPPTGKGEYGTHKHSKDRRRRRRDSNKAKTVMDTEKLAKGNALVMKETMEGTLKELRWKVNPCEGGLR